LYGEIGLQYAGAGKVKGGTVIDKLLADARNIDCAGMPKQNSAMIQKRNFNRSERKIAFFP
jgi:hypothetical protein